MEKRFGVHFIILNSIRLLLTLTFIYSLIYSRPVIQVISIAALAITFLPWFLREIFDINLPAELEIFYLMFFYGLLILTEEKGLSDFIWWDILVTLIAAIALGFVGLSIIHVLYKRKRINANPVFASIFILTFTVCAGTLWELLEFSLDLIIKSNLTSGLEDTMLDLGITVLGGILTSLAGFYYIVTGKSPLVSEFLSKRIEENLWLMGPKKITDPKIKILDLIGAGENAKTEFKSSIRTNMHTKEFDKRMEQSILKTITAFLNSRGGNLLVGIDDSGNLIGLEQDNFESDDKLSLHITNLIKSHIGNEYLPFIKFEIVQIKERKVILISTISSKKQVFLRLDGKEEFFVRNGPSSVKLEGSALIEYINNKFGN